MRRGSRLGLAAASALLAGCATSGVLRGQLSEPSGAPAPVEMRYRSDRFGDGGELSVTLPDGERFAGRFLQLSGPTGRTLEAPGGGWQYGWGGAPGDPWVGGDGMGSPADAITNRVVGSLEGDRGRSLRCRFLLHSAQRGMPGGGSGRCHASDGGSIAVEF